MSDKPIVLLGAGGHAKAIASILFDLNRTVLCAVDSRVSGVLLDRIPIVPDLAHIDRAVVELLIAIGNNQIRKRLASEFADWAWVRPIIHPSASVDRSVVLDYGTVVFWQSVIETEVCVGCHAIINSGAHAAHESRIGNYVHLAPGVHLGGQVVLGDGVFMGLNSCAVPKSTIGEWATIGAGSAVIGNIPAQVTAVGVPCTRIL